MFDLFDTPWDKLSPSVLVAWLEEAGEEGVTWEAKADDEKGRLHIDSVRKAACGLANQIGGYILIGAKWDKKARTWSLPGVTPPDAEPETWIGKAIRALQPAPRYVPRTWFLDDGRLAAVVWVESVDLPPCMTPQGRIYERVSGETLPVQDPALLDRLQRRGDAARARAEQFADRAAKRALDFVEWADGRAVGIALAIAPIGRETDDISGRLFVKSFRDAIVAATWSFWGNCQPQGIEPRQEQDAFTVTGHFEEGYDLMAGGAATRRHRSSWLLQATWDGTVVAAAHFSPGALIGNAAGETVQRAWREVIPLVERLGGYGPAQLSLVYAVTQPPDRDDESDEEVPPRALPPPGGIFERLPATTWIRRRTIVGPAEGEGLGSIQRELQRAAGIESYEPEPTTPASEG